MHASLAGSWIQWFISCDEKILTILVHICPSNSQPQAKWMTDRRTRYVVEYIVTHSEFKDTSVRHICVPHALGSATWNLSG